MKTVWVTLVLGGLLSSGAALAQDPPPRGEHRPAVPAGEIQRMEMQRHQLDLQAFESKLRFEQEMNKLTLEQRRIEVAKQKQAVNPPMHTCPMPWRQARRWHAICPLFALCGVIHILLTVWVYQDIRKRNAGSGIWIAVTLLTGLLGAAVYALVRLGDKQASSPQ